MGISIIPGDETASHRIQKNDPSLLNGELNRMKTTLPVAKINLGLTGLLSPQYSPIKGYFHHKRRR